MQHKYRLKRALLLILLATVCIGGTELVVCRFAEPALYARIVTPVIRQAETLWTAASTTVADCAVAVWDGAVSTVSRVAGSLNKNDSAPLEDQAAQEPDTSFAEAMEVDSTLTALKDRVEGEVLTGGNHEIFYFNQGDDLWSGKPYGVDTIGRYGCGPTALAMAVSSLAEPTDPVAMAQWAVDNGYWARHGGSYLSIVNGAAADFDLKVQSLPSCSVDRLRLELSGGKIAVALMSPGHFTKSGHFILLRGTTLDGSILVADPNSRERSLTLWDAQLLLDELSKSRNNGAPLWFLSPA